jgi:hypothetical protein
MKPINTSQSLLTRLWNRQIPIMPQQIIDNINDIELVFDEMDDFQFDFQKQKYIFTINKNEHPNKQRFTIAKLLAWYMLGTKNEKLVNDFIDELLIPSGVLSHLVLKQNITSINILAEKLWVTNLQILMKLKKVGLIS